LIALSFKGSLAAKVRAIMRLSVSVSPQLSMLAYVSYRRFEGFSASGLPSSSSCSLSLSS